MRISTNQVYQRGIDNILNQAAKASDLQAKLSSGKRVQTAADDPIAYVKIDMMKHRISTTQAFQHNKNAAEGVLSTEESVLNNMTSALQRLKVLQVQAGTDTMTQDDRSAIAIEANDLLDQIQALANYKDDSGSYIFSGSRLSSEAVTKDAGGNYVYNGDDTRRYQGITTSLNVALNDGGADLFMRIKNGNGDFTVSQTATPNQGTVSLTSGSVVDRAAYVPDDYTLEFALNTAGETVVMVSGAVSGNVIPLTGLPDDAPVYQAGNSISFNGMEITITGNPVAGDAFSIMPSSNESIFSTVQRMVSNLEKPYSSATQKADTKTENNQILEQLDAAMQHIGDYQSDIGARMRHLEVADQLNTDLILASQTTQSQEEDVDWASTIGDLNKQVMYLQAAQQSFSKIQNLSVFNYL